MKLESVAATIGEEPGYESCRVSRRMEAEIRRKAGDYLANRLFRDCPLPREEMGEEERAAATRDFMGALTELMGEEDAAAVLVEVRHDLNAEKFRWAKRLYEKSGDIDRFAAALRERQIAEMRACYEEGRDYFGNEVDGDVLDYVEGEKHLFFGAREGNAIVAKAIPCRTSEYLRESDHRKKRYLACHCPFARESILSEEGPVPPIFCNCSLGHTMVLWEAVLEKKLSGKVLSSALAGQDECVFEIDLPPRRRRR